LIRPGPIDVPRWEADLTEMLAQLRQRYPDTRLILSTIPTGPSTPDWHYSARPELTGMNTLIAASTAAEILNLTEVFGQSAHYDGVHLRLASYRAWEEALARRLSEPGQDP